jgi:hypothetical protein
MLELEEVPLPGRVYRLRPGQAARAIWEAQGGRVRLGGRILTADQLPAIVAEAEGRTYVVLFGLVEEDLALFGFTLQPDLCRPGLGQEVLGTAEATARQLERQALRVAITNADVVPFYFLQRQGFAIAEMRRLAARRRFGFRGLPRTHELTLRRPVAPRG